MQVRLEGLTDFCWLCENPQVTLAHCSVPHSLLASTLLVDGGYCDFCSAIIFGSAVTFSTWIYAEVGGSIRDAWLPGCLQFGKKGELSSG